MADFGIFIGAGAGPSLDSLEQVGPAIRVYFDEPMTDNADFHDPASYTITPLAGGDAVTVVSATPGPGANPLYVDLVLSNPTTGGSSYELAADPALVDAAANPMDAGGLALLFLGFGADASTLADMGIIEAMTGIFGEELAEVGGFRMTRLTAAATKGDLLFYTESTLNWPAVGRVSVDGVPYDYTGVTAVSLTGISHVAAGATVAGAIADHRDNSTVVDLSREWSALDLLRRSFCVDWAESEDLGVVGRNIGVDRLPIFTGDDQFRQVIKAVAYNPRGTVLGLELALEAMVGAGNYDVYEDLVRYPNTVFIRIDISSFMSASEVGRAYLNTRGWDTLAGVQDTLVLPETPLAVESITLADLDELFDFRVDKPSAVTYAYWPGEIPAPAFTYAGTEAEATQVIVIPGVGVEFTSAAAGTVCYEMLDLQGARIVPESCVELSMLMMIPIAAVIGPDIEQASASIRDGAFEVNVGMDAGGIGLYATSGGGFLHPPQAILPDTWYEVVVKKFGVDAVELWIDGALVFRLDYALFNAATAVHRIDWGIRGVPLAGMILEVSQLGVSIETVTDYWSARGTAGSVNVANPTRFDDGIVLIAPGDVGKALTISGGTAPNPQGGLNNGRYLIDSLVAPGIVELAGAAHADAATVAAPDRVTVDDEEAFVYPDDLGKEIVISGSALGNDGTYVIDTLIEPGTLVDYLAYSTPITGAKTNICEVVAGGFVAEPNLDYQILPVFATEPGLTWTLSDAGDFAADTISLRQGLWANDLVMAIGYTNVLSAQLLADSDVENIVGAGPTYGRWPFYLADPLGAIKAYIDSLTAAGVIPEYEGL